MTREQQITRSIMENLHNRGLLEGLSPSIKQDILEDIWCAIKVGSATVERDAKRASSTSRSAAQK